MVKRLKALVFDAYGTLFDVHSVISTCNKEFPDKGPALSQAWRAKQLEYTWLRSLMGRYKDFWRVTDSALFFACRTLNLPCRPGTPVQLMEAYLHLDSYPEVKQALNALSDYTLAILSNGSPQMLKAAVESTSLDGVFSRVISVDQVKMYKPSPRVYRLASQQLGVAKAAIGFVSSNFLDVAGTKAFGFWTCWVNRANAPPDELGLFPDATVSTLTELVDVIRT